MMRVVVVLASNNRRGAEVEGSALAAELRQRELADVEVVALASAPDGDDGLGAEVLGHRQLAPSALLRLRRRTRDADVVIAYGSSTLPACALSLSGGPPFVYRSIGDPAVWLRSRLHRERTGFAMRRAAHVVALWDDAAASLRRLYRLPVAHVSVLPNGRSTDRFTPSVGPAGPTETKTALYLGSLAPEKRVDRAIRAVAQSGGLRLRIAGTGPEEQRLRELAHDVAPGRVDFLGHVSDPVTLLQESDALVLTSSTEGIPGVAIEALLCGTPVVAPNIGGLAQVVEPGVGGILTDGSAAATAAALRTVIDPEFGDLDAARQSTVARFAVDRVAVHWASLLQSLIRGEQA